jgi:uncharacterized protein (DUF302 family)
MIARFTLILCLWMTSTVLADMPDQRAGWVIQRTSYGYADLIARTEAAIAESAFNVVTRASATMGAKSLGETIPGNMVIGVFAPAFAIRLLEASTAAGIEAPLRLYVTENDDGSATLSHETALHSLSPHITDGDGAALTALATELDAVLAAIVRDATKP